MYDLIPEPHTLSCVPQKFARTCTCSWCSRRSPMRGGASIPTGKERGVRRVEEVEGGLKVGQRGQAPTPRLWEGFGGGERGYAWGAERDDVTSSTSNVPPRFETLKRRQSTTFDTPARACELGRLVPCPYSSFDRARKHDRVHA